MKKLILITTTICLLAGCNSIDEAKSTATETAAKPPVVEKPEYFSLVAPCLSPCPKLIYY